MPLIGCYRKTLYLTKSPSLGRCKVVEKNIIRGDYPHSHDRVARETLVSQVLALMLDNVLPHLYRHNTAATL